MDSANWQGIAAAVELGAGTIYAPAEMLHFNHQAVDTEIVARAGN